RLEDGGNGRIELRWTPRLSLGNPGEHLIRARAGERPASAQLLIEHHAGGKDVRPVIYRSPGDHLRRHVEKLALQRPRLGVHPDLLGLGDAEVDHLDFTGDADVDVVGGEVAMDDAEKPPLLVHRSVSGIQSAARVRENLERYSQGDALGELGGAKPELG